jgi:hypothetical protein
MTTVSTLSAGIKEGSNGLSNKNTKVCSGWCKANLRATSHVNHPIPSNRPLSKKRVLIAIRIGLKGRKLAKVSQEILLLDHFCVLNRDAAFFDHDTFS